MNYKLTPKGEDYRTKLLGQIDSYQEEFATAFDRGAQKPKWNYLLGRRAYILDSIHTGRDIESDVESSASSLEEQKWPKRADTFRSSIKRELNELIRLGYVEAKEESFADTYYKRQAEMGRP